MRLLQPLHSLWHVVHVTAVVGQALSRQKSDRVDVREAVLGWDTLICRVRFYASRESQVISGDLYKISTLTLVDAPLVVARGRVRAEVNGLTAVVIDGLATGLLGA